MAKLVQIPKFTKHHPVEDMLELIFEKKKKKKSRSYISRISNMADLKAVISPWYQASKGLIYSDIATLKNSVFTYNYFSTWLN